MRTPTRGDSPMVQLNLRISADDREALAAEAKKAKRTLSDFVRLILEEYLHGENKTV